MAGAVNKIVNLVRNMGWRYITFRARHEILRRSGLLKNKFPVNPPFRKYITLKEWREQPAKFFFKDRESLMIPRNPVPELRETFNNIKAGKILFFNSILIDLGEDYDWVTNPDSGFKYDANKHWTEIADYSKEAGDIKYAWEKSRFSYLYDVIRYDHHFGVDCAEFVFSEILSWIKSNPINCGPNYRCSQEMSLRVMNWLFVLYYYRNSPFLTDEVFGQMQHVIYWHMHHVYRNISFSRIAVRNNHAITETLGLYLAGLYFPSFPRAAEWKKKGKQWFEEEIGYQVYADGTYLQFSMNYHRVVVQLMTWAITLSEKNGERFNDLVHGRASSSLLFLRTCMVEENGWLPNYGANDGALFFKLSNAYFRDYRPQLQALGIALGMDAGCGESEDAEWYGPGNDLSYKMVIHYGLYTFIVGGYYVIREPETLTFIRCGNHKDRPSQADNLHIDIWYKGENILLDAGSYKYNTDAETMRYFSGTQSHNAVMLDDNDQMLKGGRFIWYYWSQSLGTERGENRDAYTFSGTISAFRYLRKGIIHRRTVVKQKGRPEWRVKDEVFNAPAGVRLRQLWHLSTASKKTVIFAARNKNGNEIMPDIRDGWASSLYGRKEAMVEINFIDDTMTIETLIKAEQGE